MWTRFSLWLLTRLGRDPRGLFTFFDGRRWRSVDPLAVARAFFTHRNFDWDETPELLRSGVATVQLEAFRVIGEAVREVFAMKPVDQGGLSDLECLDLLTSFRQYLGDVKKNGNLFPTLPDSTESPCSEGLPIPTRPDWVYGSTTIEPLPAPPGSPVAAMSDS